MTTGRQRFTAHDATPLLADALAERPAGSLLDMGCGSGRNSVYAAQLGWRVLAVDVSEDAIAVTKRAAHDLMVDARIKVLHSDIVSFLPHQQFDVVLCNMVLHFLPDEAAVRSAVRALQQLTAPGGLNIVSAFTNKNEPGTRPYLFSDETQELASYYQGWQISRYESALSAPTIRQYGPTNTTFHVCRLVAQRER